MSVGPAIAVGLSSLLLVAGVGCRSAVMPPRADAARASLPGVDMGPGAPGGFGAGDPVLRRECPAPADVILPLEERILARLDTERQGFIEGLSLLRTQRGAVERAIADVEAERREAAARAREEIAASAEGLACITRRAALALDDEVTAFLADALALALPQSETTAGADARAPGGRGAPAPVGGPRSRPFPARESGPPEPEGRWVLPVVRTMAKLRRGFEEGASIRARSDALELALRRLEAGLLARRDRLRACAEPPPGGADPATGAAVGGAGAIRRARSGSPTPEEIDGAEVAGRREACARGAVDLERILGALEEGRPAACRTSGGSVVCRPPHVEIWVGSELEVLDASDPADLSRLRVLLDEFLGAKVR